MPVFHCQGKNHCLTQQDLDRAPHSVLAEARATSGDGGPVSLEAWPQPDASVLEVLLACVKALITR